MLDSQTSFVLARIGIGAREALRARGITVRCADTFPGLDSSWARIAVRPPEICLELYDALHACAPA